MKDNRRGFMKKGTARAAVTLAGMSSCTTNSSVAEKKNDGFLKDHSSLPSKEPCIKIAMQASPEPGENDIKWIRQMGIDQAVLWTNGEKSSYEYYFSRRQLFEAAGIKVFGFGNYDVHN